MAEQMYTYPQALEKLQAESKKYTDKEISNINKDLDDLAGTGNISFIGARDLVNGELRLNTMTAYRTDHPYRVCTPNIIHLEKDVNIEVEQGFRMYVLYNTDGSDTVGGNIPWITGSHTFKANETPYITFIIARTQDSASEVANLEEFASTIIKSTIISKMTDDIADTNRNVEKNTSDVEFIKDSLPKAYTEFTDFVLRENTRAGLESATSRPMFVENQSNYAATKFDCFKGDKFALTGMLDINSTYSIIFEKADGTAYRKEPYEGSASGVVDLEITIPDDVIRVWVTSNVTFGFSAKKMMPENVSQRFEKVDTMLSGDVASVGAINMMARLGYKGSDVSMPFEQTHESYKLAYQNGYKIMIFDLMVTSDGEFVCSHEVDLQSVYAGVRNLDGSQLTSSVMVAESTLEQLNGYDYGIIRGEKYSQVGITTIAWGLEFCKATNTIAHIEFKVSLTSEQMTKLENLIKAYGMQDKIIVNFGYSQYTAMKNDLISFAKMFPKAVLAYVASDISSSQLAVLKALRNSAVTNPLFIFLTKYTSINADNVSLCVADNIDIGYTEIRTGEQMEALYDSGALKYIKYLSSYVDVYAFYRSKYGL